MAIDRAAIMRRAHALRRLCGISMSAAMTQAWAEARQAKPPAIAARPVASTLRKLTGAHIEVAFRVRVDVGVRVTPRAETPIAMVKAVEVGAFWERRAAI